jgi:hypothetical protein
MPTIRDIFKAYAPEDLERYPHLPPSHRKVIRAIPHGQSGQDGHRLSPCQSWGGQHRGNHSCGHRHCPQGQQHKTQQWRQHHLAKQLPGPHFLLPCTGPATLRAFIRSPQRTASAALCKAASQAIKRLAKDEPCIGTDLPGFPGILPPWGRQLPDHPHIHSIVPGGGRAKDRAQGLPSRANFFVPVKALSPISRALFKQAMANTGLLQGIDPRVWNTNWNVHSQAHPNGQTSFTYLAPSVFQVALSTRRIVSRQDRPVTFTDRKAGSSRPRTTHLDAIEFIRRFLPHVLPEGCMKVRHVGFMNTRGAIPTDTRRRMILRQHPVACKAPEGEAPAPFVVSCPTCGNPMHLVMRRWTSHQALLDTG